MPLDIDSLLPSGKYISIFDNNGDAKVLEQPSGPCFLFFDGSDWYGATGSLASPLIFGSMASFNANADGLVAFETNTWKRFLPVDVPGTTKVLTCFNNKLNFVDAATIGLPSTGFGILSLTLGGAASYKTGTGVVGILDPATGEVVFLSGDVGDIMRWGATGPEFGPMPTGSVVAGGSGASLSGVTADRASAASVHLEAPSFMLVNAIGEEVKVTAVNVTVDFANGNAINGLDVGAEAPDMWYAIYIISDGAGAVAGLISEDFDAPDLTNCVGYTHWAFAGCFRNSGSNIVQFIQRGRDFFTEHQEWGTAMNGPASYTSIEAVNGGTPLSDFIPPCAKKVRGIVGGGNTETAWRSIQMAADTNGLAYYQVPGIYLATAIDGYKFMRGNWELPILDSNQLVYYKVTPAATAKMRIGVTGYSI